MTRTSDAVEWLPIAQAAQHLGIAERQARRYAAKLPDSDRARDRTPAGRERTLVRLSALSKAMEEARSRTPAPDTDWSEDRTPAGQSVGIAVAYEGVIKEQAARIADLQAALEHERAQAQRLTEALAREQTLRALEGPRPAPVSFWERLWGYVHQTVNILRGVCPSSSRSNFTSLFVQTAN